MNINEYALFTDKVWKSGQPAEHMSDVDTAICALGLTGESGEAAEHIKKYLRDGKPIWGSNELALELGDVLFYWARLVRRAGYTPGQIIQMNVDKLTARHASRIADHGNRDVEDAA